MRNNFPAPPGAVQGRDLTQVLQLLAGMHAPAGWKRAIVDNAEHCICVDLQRLGEPEDMAQAAVWLASDLSDCLTDTAFGRRHDVLRLPPPKVAEL